MSELEIWNELGNLYFSTGVHDKAIHAYLRAIELDPDCAQSYGNLATIYTRQGRYAEAIPLYQKAIELLSDPSDKALLWTCMGDAYRQIDDQDSAIASYMKAGELDPEAATPLAPLSSPISELRNGGMKAGSAEEAAPAAPSIDEPTPPEAISESKTDAGDRATSDAEPGSSKRHADNDDAIIEPSPLRLGGSLLSETNEDGENILFIPAPPSPDPAPTGPADEAPQPSYSAQEETIAGDASRLLASGMLQWRKGQLDKAAGTLDHALELARKLNDSWLEALCLNIIAHIETDLQKFDQAIQCYEQAAALAPEHIFPWNNLGLLYNRIGLYQKALEAFQAAVERYPRDPVSWNGLGDTYHKLGRKEDAIAAYQLGNSFEKKSSEKDNAVVCQMVLRADPENVQVWAELAGIYFEDGAHEDAIDAYRKVVALLNRPKDKAIVWNRIGDAYSRLNDFDSAVVAYQKAVELDAETAAFQEALARARQAQEESAPPSDDSQGTATGPDLSSLAAIGRPLPETPARVGIAPEPVRGSRPAAPAAEAGQAYWVFEPSAAIGTRFSPAPRAVRAAKPARQPEPGADVLTEERPRVEAVASFPDPSPAAPVEIPLQKIPAMPKKETARVVEEPAEITSDSIPLTLVETGPQPPGPRSHSLDNDIAAYRRVTEINPQNDRAWDALGNMLLEVGLYHEAITALERAIALKPHRDVYHYHLGLAYATRNRFADAIKAMRKVVELNPAHTLAHCTLARYFRQLGEDAQADEHLAFVRPSMENENEYNRACFESISGNIDGALELLAVALEKKQIQASWARDDPDLEFVRSDPRFEALTGGASEPENQAG
jgi:tetratricopeptide (TPR) repeat protein